MTVPALLHRDTTVQLAIKAIVVGTNKYHNYS